MVIWILSNVIKELTIGIGALAYSEIQKGIRGSCGVACDRWRFFEKNPTFLVSSWVFFSMSWETLNIFSCFAQNFSVLLWWSLNSSSNNNNNNKLLGHHLFDTFWGDSGPFWNMFLKYKGTIKCFCMNFIALSLFFEKLINSNRYKWSCFWQLST